MDWKQDVDVMDALSIYLQATREPLNDFLNAIGSYNDGSPLFAFLQIFGVMNNTFVDHLEKHVETDALELTIAEVANHPTVQNMVASMMQKQLDRGLQLD